MRNSAEPASSEESEATSSISPNTVADSLPSKSQRVLSIQSHTVHGYVGNKCAVFPLQLLGFEVDPINSVQFSNHTGYSAGWRGQVLEGEQLWALVDGLKANSLLTGYSHVLTGYIGSASFLNTVLRAIHTLRRENPSLTYFCDPVMGDHGKLYVPTELVEIYREQVVPLAAVLTPNQFEAELLTECPIRCDSDASAACRKLHAKGPHTVVITSLTLPGVTGSSHSGVAGGSSEESIMMLASRLEPSGAVRQWRLKLPRLPRDFTGTGDLTAALLLAWSRRHPQPSELATVIEKVGASLQAVLRRTMQVGRSEICLLDVQEELRNPRVLVHAEEISS